MLVFAPLIVLLAGCESAPSAPATPATPGASSTPRSSGKGALPANWQHAHALESPRFQLETDVPAELAPRVLGIAEVIHGELLAIFGGAAPPRMRLLVFASQYDFGAYHGVRLPSRAALAREQAVIEESGFNVLGTIIETPAGHFKESALGQIEVAVFYQDDLEGALRHELAHAFVRQHMKRLPAWLDEGIAETARLRFDARDRGRRLDWIQERLVADDAPTPQEVIGLSRGGHAKSGATGYAFSWLLVASAAETAPTLALHQVEALKARAEQLAKTATFAELLEAARAR